MADSKFSSLKTRVKTGIVLALILALVLLIGNTAIFYFICLVSLLAQWEFLSLFFREYKERNYKLLFCGIGLASMLLTRWLPELPSIFGIGAAALISTVVALKNFSHDNAWENIKKAAAGFVSFVYVPLIFGFMAKFTFQQQLMTALIPIASDTFAYFAGISFGKHKIWVNVSPKKSVEGCAAGLAASILVVLYFSYGHHVFSASLPVLLLFGAILGILAQFGDFFESALKRTVDIKDSGTILPGHGGVLDRVDSLIFTIAGFELFTLLFNSL